MPLPEPLTTVTLRGRAVDVVGDPAQPGTVTLIPLAPATSRSAEVLVTTRTIQRQIQSDGTIADITGVLLTDSPELSNRVPYLLEIRAPGFQQRKVVELLAGQAVDGVIRLEQLVPATPPPPLITYVPADAVGTPGGPAGPLDSLGQLPAEQLPPGAGGTAPVLSVDGRTGAITLADLYAALLHGHTTSQVSDFTTAVDARIHNVVGAAPAALDTLAELAAALGDDANFAATITAAITARALATRLITAGTGLSGGGDLTTNRILSVVFGSAAGTAAQGNDPRLSDPRAPTAHTHPVGDITGLQDAIDGASLYPLEGYGWHSATVDAGEARDSSGFASWHLRIWVPAGKPITKIGIILAGAGTLGAGGLNGYGVLADDGSTLLGTTVIDDTLWAASGLRVATMIASVPAQTTGRCVRILPNVQGYSSPPIAVFARSGPSDGSAFNGTGHLQRRTCFMSTLSSWPSSINPDTLGTPTEYVPLVFLG